MRAHMNRRWILVSLALAAAVAFALSVQAVTWWSAGEVTIGPFGAHHCFGGDCRTGDLQWLGGGDLWMRSAIATRFAGVIAMFVLVIVAGTLAARRVPRMFARSALVAVATALVCGGYFYAKFPGIDGVALGFGAPLYAIAIVLGAWTALAVLRAPMR